MECTSNKQNALVINSRSHICVLDFISHAADITSRSDISEIRDLDVASLEE